MFQFHVPAAADTGDMETWHQKWPLTHTDCEIHTICNRHQNLHLNNHCRFFVDGKGALEGCVMSKCLKASKNHTILNYNKLIFIWHSGLKFSKWSLGAWLHLTSSAMYLISPFPTCFQVKKKRHSEHVHASYPWLSLLHLGLSPIKSGTGRVQGLD